MILIADSGGSKTDWALAGRTDDNGRCVLKVRTQGLNPFHQPKHVILKILEEELKPALQRAVNQDRTFRGETDTDGRVSQIAFMGLAARKALHLLSARHLQQPSPQQKSWLTAT